MKNKKGKAKNNFAYNTNINHNIMEIPVEHTCSDLLILFNYKTLWS